MKTNWNETNALTSASPLVETIRRNRRAKIVATLGPSSHSASDIERVLRAGMDVARLNFSHGTHAYHLETIRTLREVSARMDRGVAILQDLQGPKIRVGKLPAVGVELKAGDEVLLFPEGDQPSQQAGKSVTHTIPVSNEIADALSRDVQVGARILFDDGKILSRVKKTAPPEIWIEIAVGGRLTSNKGMNLPGTPLSLPCLTDKDLEDLKFGIENNVDAVALSFVRSPSDLENLRREIARLTSDPPMLISKIEREEAVELQDSIIEVSDGILVARGDMAVELGAEKVPAIQKRLIHSCNELGVPIITATQMLESMISCPTPTRAEASDVANAIFDGTDAVMLSGETASGQYPIEAIETMSRIIAEAEHSSEYYTGPADLVPMPGSIVESIEFSASRIAHHVGAAAIACITHSGTAAKSLAKFRPSTPIIAILDNDRMMRKLHFVWGVQGVLIPKIVSTDDLFTMVETLLKAKGFAQNEDHIVVTAGIPSLRRGTTNMIKVHQVGGAMERATPKV